MTDSEWLALVNESPQEGYRALIDQYGNLVYAIVLNKLKGIASREDIEDCVSDIFVEVFQNSQSFNPENGSLKGYLSTIAKHSAIDAYRRLTKRYNSTASIDDEDFIMPPAEDNPEKETENKLIRRRMWDIIRNLGEPDSSIIIRQYFYEQTAREIAKASYALSPRFRRIAPSTIWPVGRCRSCISDRLVTDLPQPDSPTMPTVLPTGTSKETPSTALTVPTSVKK